MSSTTVSVFPLGAAVAVAPLAIAGAAGYGLAVAAVAASKKLIDDYQSAKTEFDARADKEALRRRQWSEKGQADQRAADNLVSAIEATPDDLSKIYIENRLRTLQHSSKKLGYDGIDSKADQIRLKVETDPADALHLLLKLSDELDQTVRHRLDQHGASGSDVATVAADIREEIAAISLGQASHLQTKRWLDKVQRLETQGESERAVALQGLFLLKHTVRRALREDSVRELRKQSQARAHRATVSEVVALLTAVSKCDAYSKGRTEARSLLEGFPQLLSSSWTDDRELRACLKKARALFEQCRSQLNSQVACSVVYDIVADALLDQGYSVTLVEGQSDSGCVIPINEKHGIRFILDGSGDMRTEAVAFSNESVQLSREDEEAICLVVDQIHEALRTKNIPVKEKTRRRFNHAGTLEVLNRSEQALAKVAAPLKARSRRT